MFSLKSATDGSEMQVKFLIHISRLKLELHMELMYKNSEYLMIDRFVGIVR